MLEPGEKNHIYSPQRVKLEKQHRCSSISFASTALLLPDTLLIPSTVADMMCVKAQTKASMTCPLLHWSYKAIRYPFLSHANAFKLL